MHKRALLILAGFSLLAGCGGGGGSTSGGVAYNGVTTQAVVTTTNAKALSIDTLTGSQASSAPSSGVAKETAGSGQASLLGDGAALLQSVTAISPAATTAAKAVAITAQNTVYGYSGSYSFTISYDPVSGACSGTMTYTQYKATSTSTTMSGTTTYTGVFNQTSGTFTSLAMTLSGVTVNDGTKSRSLNGSESYSNVGGVESITVSNLITDNVSGRTYWAKDITLTLTGTSLTIAGTYYDPIYGYVVISTVTPLTVTSIDDTTPTAGQLLFTGANNTKARLTFTASSYTVEADTAGNGTYVVVP
jgi:hypothetical protein